MTLRSARAAESDQRQIRVLVIDDHDLVRHALAAVIDAETDMQCCGALPSSVGAIDEIGRRRPHVVVVDVSFHRGGGLELLQRARRLHPGIRLVALAMYERSAEVARIYEAGAEACVTKMEMAPRVLEAIRRAYAEPKSDGVRPMRRAARDKSDDPLKLDAIEAEIIELIGAGVPSRAIATRLGLSVGAVEAYRRQIRAKLKVPSATQLVEFCVRAVQKRSA